MENTKQLFFDLILFGHTINKQQLIIMLSLLYDKSFDDSYDNVRLNGCSLFVEKSVLFFISAKKELKEIDNFIDYYKELLIKDENYELLTYLKL